MTTAGTSAVVSTGKGKMDNALKKSRWVWRPKGNYIDYESKEKGSFILKKFEYVDPKGISKFVDHAVVDGGCSSHMTGNKAYLSDYKDCNEGFMAFGSDPNRGVSLNRKSTTGGCQFLGRRLISSQCKKQTIVANSTTEAEYVAAANCFGQVLWIQNHMMDYGFNFINTKIHIDNEITISVIKNPVAHSSTKHIEIRFHFIQDCYEKRLIDVIKIYTDQNVADLLTKGFDVTRFNFLVKPNESVGFTEIVDFLKVTSLRYSLSHNPTIYDSLVKQFWQTATIRTLANGIQELVASIDNKEYTITEASVRSKLQLADAIGISNLPDAEIYEGFATLGGYAEEHVPLLPAMLAGAAEDQGEGSANPAEPNPTPIDPETEIPQSQSPTFINVTDEATTTGAGVETEGATTTTSGLDAGLDSGNIHESPLRSHEAPLHEGHTSGSVEDSLQLKELMVLVPKLVTRIDNLEKELHHTKNTYGKAVLTLVERVKSLEVALKRKTKKVVVSDFEDEETENQGRKIQDIDDNPLVSLVRESMEEKAADLITPTKISASGEVVSQRARSTDKGKRYKRKTRTIDKDISTGLDAEVKVSPGRVIISSGSAGVNTDSTPVSTPSIVQKANVIISSPVKGQREGKAPMSTEDDEKAVRQVHLDALLAKRISEEQELSEQQEKRKAEVQEAAQHYSEEDWDNIRAKLEANTELVKDVLGE
ncbi:hypothetical protein Tco_0600396 [Tanacetum coccineum]|uniref:Uncharacterized protein n=1 Tax=Tanacetum coccineum TaxID=301880 RepID=A0ABQ4WBR4_9ASTR